MKKLFKNKILLIPTQFNVNGRIIETVYKNIYNKPHGDIIKIKQKNNLFYNMIFKFFSHTEQIFKFLLNNEVKNTNDTKNIIEFNNIKCSHNLKIRLKEHYFLNKILTNPGNSQSKIERNQSDLILKFQNSSNSIFDLINSLEFLDYKAYLAINKYLIENLKFSKFNNTFKNNILSFSLELFQNKKRNLTQNNSSNENNIKEQQKNIEYLKIYDEAQNKSFEKDLLNHTIQKKIKKILKKEHNYYLLKDPIMDDNSFNFNTEIDQLIRSYRKERLSQRKFNIENIIKIVSSIFDHSKFENENKLISRMNKAELKNFKIKELIEDNEEYERKEKKKKEQTILNENKYEKIEKNEKNSEIIIEKIKRLPNWKNHRGSYSSLRRSLLVNEKSIRKLNRFFWKEKYLLLFRNKVNRNNLKINDYLFEKKFRRRNEQKNEFIVKNKDKQQHSFSEIWMNKNKEDIITLMTFFIIKEKLFSNIEYKPSNLEIEKYIYGYLKNKLDNNDYNLNEEIIKSFIPFMSKNNSNKEILNNFIKSKNKHDKMILINKFNSLYSNQLGLNITNYSYKVSLKDLTNTVKINNKIFPINIKIEKYDDYIKNKDLIKDIIDNYYKEFKIIHMYHNSNKILKNKIKKQASEIFLRKYSINEMNQILKKLKNILEGNMLNTNLTNYSSLFNTLEKLSNMKDSEIKYPKIIYDTYIKNKFKYKLNKIQNQKIVNALQFNDYSSYYNNFEAFEINFYKSIKKDPFFKHSIQNFLIFQCDQKNNFEEIRGLTNKIKNITNSLENIGNTSNVYEEIFKNMNEFSNDDMDKYYNIMKNVSNKSENDIINKEKNTELERRIKLDNFKIAKSGKRKTARASVIMTPGIGIFTINNIPLNNYFSNEYTRAKALLPLSITNLIGKVDIRSYVRGSGDNSQAEALIPAIGKCIVELDQNHFKILNENLMLTNDPRIVERKKPGLQKARKGQVYRRR